MRKVTRSRRRGLGIATMLAVCALMAGGTVRGSAAGITFSTVYVDGASGGGEPYVIYSHAGHDLVYSSHEGTTLTKSGNAGGSTNCDINPGGPDGYLCSYDNQVNIWYSTDNGHTWTKSLGNPTDTGFSDPSLTEDECVAGSCNVYDTGIDLLNDALYASSDGGATWVGTPQCTPNGGDRPWLAGGHNGEVFLSSNANVGGHTIYHGTVTQVAGHNVAVTCAPTGITDSGGVGQLYYDHHNGDLIEPKISGGHIGIGVLPNASAFTGSFASRLGPSLPDGVFAHWPAIAISTDSSAASPAGTIYEVWDTDPRSTAVPHNGCSGSTGSAIGGNTLLQNAVMLSYSQNEGVSWSTPMVIANTGGTVQWPWVTAGADGNVSVTWYQGNQVSDPDCDSANLVCQSQPQPTTCPTQWSIRVSNIYGLTSGTPDVQMVNAVQNFDGKHPNGTIHVGGVCEGGTTCVATGEDRRIGDFFTNSLDQNGCVLVASGDTQQVAPITGQPLPNALPIFVKQISGPSLTTGQDCSGFAADVPEVTSVVGIVGAGLGAALLVSIVRRRRSSLQGYS